MNHLILGEKSYDAHSTFNRQTTQKIAEYKKRKLIKLKERSAGPGNEGKRHSLQPLRKYFQDKFGLKEVSVLL